MRLTELLGTRVRTRDGRVLGKVRDALLIQDGPVGTGTNAALRLHALAVGRRAFGTRLGFATGHVRTPTLLRRAFGEELILVPWSAIVERNQDEIVVDERYGCEEPARDEGSCGDPDSGVAHRDAARAPTGPAA